MDQYKLTVQSSGNVFHSYHCSVYYALQIYYVRFFFLFRKNRKPCKGNKNISTSTSDLLQYKEQLVEGPFPWRKKEGTFASISASSLFQFHSSVNCDHNLLSMKTVLCSYFKNNISHLVLFV